jgi:hypothetical protein
MQCARDIFIGGLARQLAMASEDEAGEGMQENII